MELNNSDLLQFGIYILKRGDLLDTNIYKIGKTERTLLTRYNEYTNIGTKIFHYLPVNQTSYVERYIIRELKKNKDIKIRLDYGKEYFEGELNIIFDVVNRICNNKKYKVNHELDILKLIDYCNNNHTPTKIINNKIRTKYINNIINNLKKLDNIQIMNLNEALENNELYNITKIHDKINQKNEIKEINFKNAFDDLFVKTDDPKYFIGKDMFLDKINSKYNKKIDWKKCFYEIKKIGLIYDKEKRINNKKGCIMCIKLLNEDNDLLNDNNIINMTDNIIYNTSENLDDIILDFLNNSLIASINDKVPVPELKLYFNKYFLNITADTFGKSLRRLSNLYQKKPVSYKSKTTVCIINYKLNIEYIDKLEKEYNEQNKDVNDSLVD